MPEPAHEIVVSPAGAPHRLDIRVNGRPSGFDLGTEPLSARLVAEVPPRLLDFLEVAAAVFAADSQVSRGGSTRSRMGETWRRRFAFRIAVREPEFWSQGAVTDALAEAIEFMSEDEASFDFERAAQPVGLQNYFDFAPDADVHRYEDVVLFSGGLDSLAGALDTLAECEGRIALVTHLSAQKRMPVQRDLAEEMVRRFGDRVLPVPVKARRHGGRRPPETTQRTRSLLFAAIGVTVQRMLGAGRLSLFENGVVSQNLPISPQVIGTMATRTTHPRTLHHLRALLGLVAGEPVTLHAPYEWLTKTEVVERVKARGGADLIARTVSCSQIWEREAAVPHCGCCSQCLDRRFAVLAAGLAEHDPEATYATDVFAGARATDRDQVLALEWSRNGRDLKDLGDIGFVDRFGREMASIARGFPDRPAYEVMAAIVDLHRRHGRAVLAAMTAAVRHHAEEIAAGRLAPGSLIAAFARGGTIEDAAPRPGTAPPPPEGADESAAAAEADIFPLQVRLFRFRKRPAVEILNLGTVTGAHVGVVGALRPVHEEDRQAGLARDQCRYVLSGRLAGGLGISKSAVGVRVKRCREEFAAQYLQVTGQDPPRRLLIESEARGYRVDPDARFLASGEGRDDSP